MSILNDLDPENARIPPASSKANNRLVAWASALLLLVAGVVWIYIGKVFDDKNTLPISPVALASDGPVTPPLSLPPAASAAPTAEATGAALIRAIPAASGEKVEAEKQPNAFAALQDDPVTSSKTPAAASKSLATKASQRTEQKTNSPAKAGKRQANKGSGSVQSKTRSAKKPAERDIDIISAIVK